MFQAWPVISVTCSLQLDRSAGLCCDSVHVLDKQIQFDFPCEHCLEKNKIHGPHQEWSLLVLVLSIQNNFKQMFKLLFDILQYYQYFCYNLIGWQHMNLHFILGNNVQHVKVCMQLDTLAAVALLVTFSSPIPKSPVQIF